MRRSLAALVALAGACAAVPSTGRGQNVSGAERVLRIVDRPLVEARGARHTLAELVNRSDVVVSFTFTGCQALCPPADAVMDDLARRVDPTSGVTLVTLTLDPLTDTPDQLRRERAERLDPARLFLTGDLPDVEAVLAGLGVDLGANQAHPIEFLVIRKGGGQFIPFRGLPEATTLMAAVDDKP